MHVTRVELEQIKSYESADFHFDRGTIAITGENGAGKTTILEAIAWTLFDTLEYSKDDFLRRGAKRGSVRVTFESDIDERQYVVYRDTGTGYYIHDPALGVRIAEKKADVTTMLRKLLGIEPGTDVKALFRSAIGVAQGTFTAEFLLPATARKAAFDRLLKVEEYREGAERLRETVNLIRDRITDVRERIAGAEGQLSRYDEQVAEHQVEVSRVAQLEAQFDDIRDQIEKQNRAVEEMNLAEANVSDVRARLAKLEVERDATARRLRDVVAERDAARSAVEKQREIEPDHRKHLDSLEKLKSLEVQRNERDVLRAEGSRIEAMLAAAKNDVRRLNDAVERAVNARAALEALGDKLNEQGEFEKERERLRELRARALSERERLRRLDTELDSLRKSHAQLKAQAKDAETCHGALPLVEQLENERLGIETSLSSAEKAATSLAHLKSQRVSEVREAERLRRQVAALEKEIATIETKASYALQATQLGDREHQLSEQLAKLKAEIARDEKFHSEVKNGLCPILSEKCLNIAEGQTLEDYFKNNFAANTEQLKMLEAERAGVSAAVRDAREAEKHLARLESAQKQLASDRELLTAREGEVARIDQQIVSLSAADAERLRSLKFQLLGIDGEIKVARDSALRYAELQPLLQRLKEIEEEGKQKREEREAVAAAAAAVESLDNDIKEVEQRLSLLNDPRSRAAVLRAEAESADARRDELAGAKDAESTLTEQKNSLAKQLVRYEDLDTELNEAVGERDRTSAAHRDYVASEAIAATLPAREAETERAEAEALRIAAAAEATRDEAERAMAAYDREAHLAARTALANERERAAVNSAQLEAARLRVSNLTIEIARLDGIRATMREEFQAKEHLETLRDTTEFIRDTLKTAGPLVTESYLYNISVEANQLFREITGGAGRTLRWSRDYEIIIEEEGFERSFPNLSGGEQMAAALSIRLALLKQLSDIRLAFFDEPTVNMDAERRERLAQQIGQIQHFDQLFVISHDDTFEESVDHILHIARHNGDSAVTEAAWVERT